MKNASMQDTVAALVESLLDSLGFELVDLVYRQEAGEWVLRIYIDKEGGVNLDDCAGVSHEVGALLEVEDVIRNAYRLEISSPGLDRPLKKEGDYSRFVGRLAKIKVDELMDPDGRGHERKTFVGILGGVDNGCVILEQNDKSGGEVRLPLASIVNAHLEIEF